MTDFRALCAELVDAIDASRPYATPLLDRARAALAEPRPVADGEVAATGKPRLQDGPAVQSREPASVIAEPSDEELLELMPETMRDEFSFAAKTCSDVTGGQVKPGIFRVCLNTAALEYARAVLAHWGTLNLAETRSSLEPIPVSERPPEAGDFDELGRVWWWYPETAGTLGYWQWEAGAMERQEDEQPSHWLPYHALPLPKEVE